MSSVLFGNGCVSGSAKLEPRKGHRGGGKPGWICSLVLGSQTHGGFSESRDVVLLMFLITKAPHAAQTSHIFSINAAMLQNRLLLSICTWAEQLRGKRTRLTMRTNTDNCQVGWLNGKILLIARDLNGRMDHHTMRFYSPIPCRFAFCGVGWNYRVGKRRGTI